MGRHRGGISATPCSARGSEKRPASCGASASSLRFDRIGRDELGAAALVADAEANLLVAPQPGFPRCRRSEQA